LASGTTLSVLDHFVDVGVVEWISGRRLVGHRLPPQHRGCALEIVEAAGLLAFLKCEGNGHLPIGLDAGEPERVVEVHRRERNRLDRVVPLKSLLGIEAR
jgi:hypothetical protein